MVSREIEEETVKAFQHLLSKNLIKNVDVIRAVYKMGFEAGYSISDSQKNQESQLRALAGQGVK